jgi:uncharacterized membrane protein
VTLYELLLFVHIASVVTWVGGNITVQLVALRALASGEPARMAGIAADADWIGKRVYTPAALLVLGAGIWMVLEADLGFGRGWIIVGLAGFAFSLIIGATFNGPESARIGRLIEERGPADPEVARRIKRILLSGRLELLVMLAVIFFMATKAWD